jgi:hypothetical protein
MASFSVVRRAPAPQARKVVPVKACSFYSDPARQDITAKSFRISNRCYQEYGWNINTGTAPGAFFQPVVEEYHVFNVLCAMKNLAFRIDTSQ